MPTGIDLLDGLQRRSDGDKYRHCVGAIQGQLPITAQGNIIIQVIFL